MTNNTLPHLPASLFQTASPAPIHDIVGPVSFFPYTTSQVILTLVMLFLILAILGYFIWRARRQRPLTKGELMLQALAAMKKDLMLGTDHDFGIRVSTLLRNYLNAVFGLAAPLQTTEEFLKSLHGKECFSISEQEALTVFLRQSDVLKFAQGIAEAEERLNLIEAAEQFVKKGMEVSA